MGFTRYDKKYNQLVSSEKGDIKSFIVKDKGKMESNNFVNQLIGKFKKDARPLVFEDLKEEAKCCDVSKSIFKQGVGSLIIAPIIYDGDIIAVVEFASPNAGDFNVLSTVKLEELLPMLANAAYRSLREFDSAVQGLIKEKFTSLHSSVEWKFEEVALNLIKKQQQRRNR